MYLLTRIAGSLQHNFQDPYLMGVDPHRNSKRSGESKVSELDDTFLIDEQVLWLQVSMQYPMRMAKNNAKADLVQIALQHTHAQNYKTIGTQGMCMYCNTTNFLGD